MKTVFDAEIYHCFCFIFSVIVRLKKCILMFHTTLSSKLLIPLNIPNENTHIDLHLTNAGHFPSGSGFKGEL